MNAHSKTTDFAAGTSPLVRIAGDVASLAMQLRGIKITNRKEVAAALALPEKDIGRILVELHKDLRGFGARFPADLTTGEWLCLCIRSEGIAKKCAEEEWPRYAVNPLGLTDMVGLVSRVQREIRDIANKVAPAVAAAAIDAVYLGQYPGSDAPTATPPAGAPDPDAALLDLGAHFELAAAEMAAYDIEGGDEGYEALRDAARLIADDLRRMSPQTLAGFRVLARVVQWCQSDNPSDPVELISGDAISDSRVAQKIINDLLQIAEPSSEELEARRAVEVEAGERLRGMRAPANEPEPYDAEKARLAWEWKEARDAFYALRDVKLSDDTEADPDGDEAVLDARADAMEAWETLTPPTWEAYVEMMRESLAFNGLEWAFSDIDDPRTMRDMLDGGDTHEVFAARYYMHALRLSGSDSQALLTPPIACLFPKFNSVKDTPEDAAAEDVRIAWNLHHGGNGKPHPSRGDVLGREPAHAIAAE